MIETKTLKRSSTNSDIKMEVNAISDYLKPNMPLPQYLPYARFLLDTDLKRALRSLEDADLIERRRGRITVPNSIFVKVPTEQKCSFAWNDSALCDGTEMIPSTEQKCSTNQRNKNNLKDNHLIKTTDAYLTFGEYQNVFLTEKEYKRLKADFAGLDGLIEQLSAYVQSTGRKYADHAATLRIWAKRQKSEQKQAPGIPDYTFKEGESL